jgi:hypothetical protein
MKSILEHRYFILHLFTFGTNKSQTGSFLLYITQLFMIPTSIILTASSVNYSSSLIFL